MRWVKRVAVSLVVLILAALTALYLVLRGSLPALDGTAPLPGLAAPVTLERDAEGVPTLTGEDRVDVARALGFVHAQERFFQMDLMRRRAAGELAALVGAAALPLDRQHRLHRMRARAERRLAVADPDRRAILEAYTDGVNAGLDSLSRPPFEYLLLRQAPEPWRAEDCALVVSSMFFELNDENGAYESNVGLLFDRLPEPLAAFLTPLGTKWDAPLDGGEAASPDVPEPGSLRLAASARSAGVLFERHPFPRENIGSNNWALSGTRTAHGGALLANDMHLGHSVPNIWFRALLRWQDRKVIGVTLPGVPFVVVGSNTRVAWGFTNSNGDWVDLVEIETDPGDRELYRTPTGLRAFEMYEERLDVAGGEPETFVVRETIWGPVVDEDHRGVPRAARWIAHDLDGIGFELIGLESAANVSDAIAIAQRSGIPPQNFVCADADGSIGWTLTGRIPRRIGFDGRRPTSWASGERRWDGWVAPEDHPTRIDPDGGLLWTANARTVSGAELALVGDGGYAFGARALQIRDDLIALSSPSELDMLDVQLDDRALFMRNWRDYFLEWIEDEELRALLETDWTGHASPDSSAYRLVRELRLAIFEEVFEALTAPAREADPRFRVGRLRQWDGPLWMLVEQRPDHLVPAAHSGWDAWIEDIVRRAVSRWREQGPLVERTWGERMRAEVRHPLSAALPALSRWLDMPPDPLSGDSNMPKAQSSSQGASERLVVSPGREEDGLFHMPGGQSGHPLSSYYGAGHRHWVQGRPTPLLPGPTVHRLELRNPRSR